MYQNSLVHCGRSSLHWINSQTKYGSLLVRTFRGDKKRAIFIAFLNEWIILHINYRHGVSLTLTPVIFIPLCLPPHSPLICSLVHSAPFRPFTLQTEKIMLFCGRPPLKVRYHVLVHISPHAITNADFAHLTSWWSAWQILNSNYVWQLGKNRKLKLHA